MDVDLGNDNEVFADPHGLPITVDDYMRMWGVQELSGLNTFNQHNFAQLGLGYIRTLMLGKNWVKSENAWATCNWVMTLLPKGSSKLGMCWVIIG